MKLLDFLMWYATLGLPQDGCGVALVSLLMPSSDTGRGGGLTNHPGGILGAVTTQKTANKRLGSIGWFKGRITGNSYILWENLWFPIDFPLSEPIEWCKKRLRE